MAKKIVKKKKIKIFNLFIVLIILSIFSFCIYLYLQIPIKNIIIKGTKYLNDDYIIELAKIKNYPKYYSKDTFKIMKNLKKSPYIEDVKVERKFFHVLEITVTEKTPIYFRDSDKKTVFLDQSSSSVDLDFTVFRIPRLLNYVPDNISSDFVNKLGKLNSNVLSRISDIMYSPNDLDKERFLLYMDDGNMVYLTLTKFKMINYYNDVLEQLENRKGILYLDNGNHFQIKE